MTPSKRASPGKQRLERGVAAASHWGGEPSGRGAQNCSTWQPLEEICHAPVYLGGREGGKDLGAMWNKYKKRAKLNYIFA